MALRRMQRLMVKTYSPLLSPDLESFTQADINASMFVTMECILHDQPFSSAVTHLSFTFVAFTRLLFLSDSDWGLQMAQARALMR